MKQPANVVFLAAELAAAGVPSGRAAFVADKLCRWGRSYKRISEKLCGGEEEWGPWSSAVELAQERARQKRDRIERRCEGELVGFTQCKIARGDLHLSCLAGTEETALL